MCVEGSLGEEAMEGWEGNCRGQISRHNFFGVENRDLPEMMGKALL